MKYVILGPICALGLVGCTDLSPEYQAPSINLAPQFVATGSTTLNNAEFDRWWERLNDPYLNRLMARGAQNNLDIRAAVERVLAADAALGQTGLNSQLSGSLTGSATRTDTGSETINSRGAQIDARYVIDLFGATARAQEQALANFDAAQLDVGVVRLAFMAELTNSYIQARYYQEAAAITRQTIASRRQTLSIVQQRRNINEATELELQQARSLLAAAEAPLPVLVANFEVNVFRIATLLGEPAGPILAQMKHGAPQPRPTGFTTVGLPADLLRNRPDVRFAERNLAAATAAVGVAEAQLYPSVTIGGTLGTGSADDWSFGPRLNLPILTRGILRSSADIAQANAREAELGWRQSVLIAVEEVQSALTLCRNWYRQLQFLERATQSSANVLSLSREVYSEGAATLTDVLDAERLHASNKLAVADAVRNYTNSWMQVQVATGRGWGAQGLTNPIESQPATIAPDPLGVSN